MSQSERLANIKDEIKELIREAKGIVRFKGGITYERARSYWLAHIIMALDKDHEFLGGSMFTMQDTIKEMKDAEEAEEAMEDAETETVES